MENTPIINYQLFTKLPLKQLYATNKTGGIVEVKTPHKGTIEIDLEEREVVGFIFTHDENRPLRSEEIISKLRTLELESKQYLLNEWVKNSLIPQ